MPAPTSVPATLDVSNDTWETIADGLDTRIYIPNENEFARLVVMRIDPTQYSFRAVYRAGDPLNIIDWQRAEPDATIIINANFFSPEYTVQGLLVSDGQIFGTSYGNRGGTFVVQNGLPSVRANQSQPYQGEPLEQAIQAYPLLVENSQSTYFDRTRAENTRRTVIAQDVNGNILIMVTPFIGLSLADLSEYLPTTDMNIVTAFNLDGGGSTMMAVPDMDYILSAFDRVPAILAVYPR